MHARTAMSAALDRPVSIWDDHDHSIWQLHMIVASSWWSVHDQRLIEASPNLNRLEWYLHRFNWEGIYYIPLCHECVCSMHPACWKCQVKNSTVHTIYQCSILFKTRSNQWHTVQHSNKNRTIYNLVWSHRLMLKCTPLGSVFTISVCIIDNMLLQTNMH